MLDIKSNVFFLYSDKIQSGQIAGITTERTIEGTAIKEFKIDTGNSTYTVGADRVYGDLEGVLKGLLDSYLAATKRIKNRPKAIQTEVDWSKVLSQDKQK